MKCIDIHAPSCAEKKSADHMDVQSGGMGANMQKWRFFTSRFPKLVRLLIACAACKAVAAGATPLITPAKESLGSLSLPQLQHRVYTTADGAPNAVMAIAQTSDGFLWLGSPDGLVRFDGVNFDDSFGKRLPSPNVYALYADSDALWIGYPYGGVSELQGGHLVNYSDADVKVGGIRHFFRRPGGELWALGSRGIARLVEDRWRPVGAENGFPDRHIQEVADNNGTLWVVSDKRSYVLAPGARRFQPVDPDQLRRSWMQVPAGVPWRLPMPDTYAGIIDAVGDLWLYGKKGLARYRWSLRTKPYAVETMTAEQGLSGDYVGTMLQDQEGNIWVGTTQGLDKFSAPKFTKLAIPGRVQAPSFAFASDGSLWIGSMDRNVLHMTQGVVSATPMGKSAWSIFADSQGSIWSGNDDRLQRWRDGKLNQVPLPPALASLDADVIAGLYQALTVDQQGGLWFSLSKYDLYRLYQGKWTLRGGVDGLPAGPPIRLLADDVGRMWFTYPGNRVAVLDHGRLDTYTSADGLAVGNVQTIHVRGSQVWVGGDRGVARFDRGRFVMLHGVNDEKFIDTAGLIVTRSGELWLDTSAGVYRVSAEEVARVSADPSHEVAYELFNQQDGLAGVALQIRPGPTLQEDAAGRLWVARLFGLSSIDPAHILRNTVAPTILIESLQADDNQYSPTPGLVLPKLTRNLRIDYTAPSLTSPKRVNFRYRLEGVDAIWQDAGTRRQAFYTNLDPGTYAFRVKAVNEDGTWSARDAVFKFRIAPAFYQTLLFKVLMGTLVLALLWSAYLWRLHQLASRVRIRTAERERIARELHDTLLQGIQGLQLRLQTWADDPAVAASRRSEMSKAVKYTHDLLIDGRDRIVALRHSGSAKAGVASILKEIGHDYASLYPACFSMCEDGQPRAVYPDIAGEVIDISREGLRNAFVHARATNIGLVVAWRPRWLEIIVHDDGCGIDEAILYEGRRVGHWGLIGMRERAEKIGGRFVIKLGDTGGTELRLAVPARAAYSGHHRWF